MPVTISGTTGGIGLIGSGTLQNTTSGTNIDFTGIPSGVKRITVGFNGVSTNGTSYVMVQLGAGSFTTTGYTGCSINVCGGGIQFSTGFAPVYGAAAGANTRYGLMIMTLIGSNTWVCTFSMGNGDGICPSHGGGAVTLSGTLDRVRITTVNGTDTFDAGSVNILYE